jgi:AraC-like DNA-binding protein
MDTNFSDGITSTVISLLAEAESAFDTDRAVAKAYLVRACELLNARLHASGSTMMCSGRGGLAPWQKLRIEAHIQGHLACRIEMSDLTSIVRLSTSHFARAFKKSFGAAPFAYIACARIERAKRLMLETDLALSQIALECGMCDQSHFTRVFSRVAGTSPNNWRRAHSSGTAFTPVSQIPVAQRQGAV